MEGSLGLRNGLAAHRDRAVSAPRSFDGATMAVLIAAVILSAYLVGCIVQALDLP